MSQLLDEVENNNLIISHHNNIQVFVNKLKNKLSLQSDLYCQYDAFYKLQLNDNKQLVDFKLLFVPPQ